MMLYSAVIAGCFKRPKEGKTLFFLKRLRNTTMQTLWDRAKAVLRGKVIALQDYLKNKKNLK